MAWMGGCSPASYELFLDILRAVLASRVKVTLHSSPGTKASGLRKLMADLGEADTEAMAFAADEQEELGDTLLVHTLVGGAVHFYYELPGSP